MRLRRLVLVVGAAGCFVAGGEALGAASTSSQGARLKQTGTAQIAGVHGLRFVVGRYVIASAQGSAGVAPLTYAVARCPRGTHALGGGWNSSDTTNDPITFSSNEAGRDDALWLVAARDLSSDPGSPGFAFAATAVCG